VSDMGKLTWDWSCGMLNDLSELVYCFNSAIINYVQRKTKNTHTYTHTHARAHTHTLYLHVFLKVEIKCRLKCSFAPLF